VETVKIKMKAPGAYTDDRFLIVGFVGDSWQTRLDTIGPVSVKIEK
jgi:hypothetical protein